jgi:hypothetical protein
MYQTAIDLAQQDDQKKYIEKAMAEWRSKAA